MMIINNIGYGVAIIIIFITLTLTRYYVKISK